MQINSHNASNSVKQVSTKVAEHLKTMEELYWKNTDKAIDYGNANLSEDVWVSKLDELGVQRKKLANNKIHEQNLQQWQKELNPFQKVVNAVLGDHATRLGVPAKPEHPDVISARKAAERREYFGMDTGFTGHDN